MLRQGLGCLRDVAYPIRRIVDAPPDAGIGESQFRSGYERIVAAGFPVERSVEDSWPVFAAARAAYAPLVYQLVHMTVAAPAPWSGTRAGFPGLEARPEAPDEWLIS